MDMLKYRRYKVTKLYSDLANEGVFIDKTKDIEVVQTFVTFPATTQNYELNVNLERQDGTILGREYAIFLTSDAIGVNFSDGFILPSYDPIVRVTTPVAFAAYLVTIDMFYKEVDVQ